MYNEKVAVLIIISIMILLIVLSLVFGYKLGSDMTECQIEQDDLFDAENNLGYINLTCVMSNCIVINDEESFNKHIEKIILDNMEEDI